MKTKLTRALHQSLRIRSFRTALVAACAATLGLSLGFGAALASAATVQPVGIAFVYLGNPGDAGWTYAHEQGVKEVEAKFGDKIKVTRVENVPESADSERVFRDLASKGNKIVVGSSFGFQDFELKVAKDFPDTVFEHATGYKKASNFATYDVRTYQSAYLAGLVAGYTTKSNTLGFVGSVPVPEVVRNINAFTMGARSVNPKARVKVVWINSWFDPGLEKQAAETLIGQGADVLIQNTDSTATMQTAEQKKVHAFGWDSNMKKFGPNAQLGACVSNWGVYYSYLVQQVVSGTWNNTPVWWGLKEKAIDLADINTEAVSPAAQKALSQKRDEIVSGKFNPFAGPIMDQSGAVKVAAGKSLSDPELLRLNWFVQGVDGSLPK
ncbi:BMP family ABC transporter substrate-binding protein [Paraburkholderia rhynchosiae]|uniref:BMP family ABC transporter substrate-binding protein n=1 Tax=Paraburkholderia rhynchosiae TaxID=487049 RepID=A0A2N7WVN0_9BURK|nr:BMP family ABC transporter substrate-binding protein [Paraburkholderia rhynchosiae]PMS33533.1 BMP family ABC transporter substrate-binding protein [Paraburkholderia rhynchosiae]CAB3680348.1 Purine-binding protein [Paraburkholderia rhynchosiae]